MKILIKNGHVVCPKQKINGKKDILISDGKIKKIETPGNIKEKDISKVIDAKGKYVVPGLIDMHTHLREPGHEGAETILTGTRAAASGGYTSISSMPNTKPVTDNAYVTSYIKNKVKEEGIIDVNIIGAITKGQDGEEIAEILEMKKAGIVAISDDGHCVMNSYVMRKAMDYASQFDLLVIDHCEDTNLKGQGLMNDGYYSMKLGLRGVPAVSEDIMVSRDIALSDHTKCRVHIAHVSTSGSMRLIREAKKDKIPVTCEVTPHHIFLTEKDVETYDPNTKVNPPLRTKEDVKAIIKGIKDGTVDAVATDHAPHSIEKKAIEFQLAKSGMIGLETALPLCLNLVRDKVIDMTRLIELMSLNPAKILKIPGGTLEVNENANISIFDMDKKWTYTEEKIVSKSKNSPFKDKTLKGKVMYTIHNGKIVWEEK
jgi:dihydroorotase